MGLSLRKIEELPLKFLAFFSELGERSSVENYELGRRITVLRRLLNRV